MASSLEVLRQRITSPVRYPLPQSSHKRFASTGIVGAPQFGSHGRMVPLGFVGRHSWSAVSPQTNSLIANRVQHLNLRFSPPTPGEQELCRSWMQNSAKHSKRHHDEKSKPMHQNYNRKERPKTAQSPGLPQDVMAVRHASHPRTTSRVKSPSREYMTSSDSERIASPSASHRSSPPHPVFNGMRKMRKIPEERHTFGRGEASRFSPNNTENNLENPRAPTRPHSARPHEARMRSRARASRTPPNVTSGIAGNFHGNTESRRWSLSEAIMNQYETRDDDSAYSSSRDITIHTDRAQLNSPGSPPRSAPNPHPAEDHFRSMPGGRLSRARMLSSKVKMSGQDGRPVFYHDTNTTALEDDIPLSRQNTLDVSFVPLRRPSGRRLQRPVTQPAMETSHSRRNYNRRMKDSQQLRDDMEDRLRMRALSRDNQLDKQNNKFPGVKNSNSICDGTTRHWTSITIEQRTMKSISQFVEPDLLKRILDWLTNVEPNPKLYYGFEN